MGLGLGGGFFLMVGFLGLGLGFGGFLGGGFFGFGGLGGGFLGGGFFGGGFVGGFFFGAGFVGFGGGFFLIVGFGFLAGGFLGLGFFAGGFLGGGFAGMGFAVVFGLTEVGLPLVVTRVVFPVRVDGFGKTLVIVISFEVAAPAIVVNFDVVTVLVLGALG